MCTAGNHETTSIRSMNGKQQQQQQSHAPSPPGLARLAMCTAGICICYLYYGLLQERLFTGSTRLGATFVLVTQCVTNCAVAVVWQQVKVNLQPSQTTTTTTTHQDATLPTSRRHRLGLRHGLLLVTSGCYVGAMTCSNEAIQYVSYPVAVLAKSCKLIPTMLVGQFVEGRFYSKLEWMAALLISSGIVLFHWNPIWQHQPPLVESSSSSSSSLIDNDPSISAASHGMILLLISLSLDGVLASCQNFLKQSSSSSGRATFRVPDAVESMFWINAYALVFLVPLSMLVGQWQTGMDLLWWSPAPSSSSSSSLLRKLVVLNGTVALGQIFIFLTISWYTPVMTTTITTTRKFVTILLSVWTYGHVFSTIQWTAVALVFAGLYVAIWLVQQPVPSRRQDEDSDANNDKNKIADSQQEQPLVMNESMRKSKTE